MKSIGILACRMLEDEIVYLAETDPGIREITVIGNGEQAGLTEKFDELGIKYTVVPDVSSLKDRTPAGQGGSMPEQSSAAGQDDAGFSLVVWELEVGLHEIPKTLKEAVYENIRAFSEKVNGIMLFYGLCGNVLGKVESECSTADCPVMVLRDYDNEVVDDCIGATIGGRGPYLSLLKSFHGEGTFIFTPMYAATTEEFFEYSRDRKGLTEEEMYEMNQFMFDECNYKHVGNLETGLHYTKNVEENIKRFADKYHFDVIPLSGGSQDLFVENFRRLKEAVL